MQVFLKIIFVMVVGRQVYFLKYVPLFVATQNVVQLQFV